MIDTYSAGGVVLNNSRMVLVVNQHLANWSLPKGHVNKNENSLDAARREIAEETGIDQLNYITDLGTYQRSEFTEGNVVDESIRKNVTMFLFKTNQNELQPIDPNVPEARWVEMDKVAELLTHPKDQEFFRSVVDQVKTYVAE